MSPFVGSVFQLLFHLVSCFSLYLSCPLTDSSLAQAFTAWIPLSWHIYTTKNGTEQGKKKHLPQTKRIAASIFSNYYIKCGGVVRKYFFVVTPCNLCVSLEVRSKVVKNAFLLLNKR